MLHAFGSADFFFQNQLFRKILLRIPSQNVKQFESRSGSWPHKISGLNIWVHTVCKSYQQMTLVGKQLTEGYLYYFYIKGFQLIEEISIPHGRVTAFSQLHEQNKIFLFSVKAK